MTKEELEQALIGTNITSLAKTLDTYPNKLRRLAKKLGVSLPTHSEAQSNLLKQGKTKHPTQGRKRTEQERQSIAKGIYDAYEGMSEEDRENIRETHRKVWEETPEAQKHTMKVNSAKAVRKTADEGSKTENFVKTELMNAGYVVEHHKKGLIPNEKLEIDVFLPTLHTVVEVNGPSHYNPIRGEEKLAKQKASDALKYGLLISSGFNVVVVKHLKDPSGEYHRRLLEELLKTLKGLKKTKGGQMLEIEI